MYRRQKLVSVFMPVASIVLALLVGCVIIAMMGASPVAALGHLFQGAFGTRTNIAATLIKASPLIFTGLCACFAYRCGVYNLGGEGQFIMGSVAALWASVSLPFQGSMAAIICLVAGFVAGGLWGAIPGILKVTRGLNEMIVSIMLNYVATLFMGLVFTTLLREGGVPQTMPVPEATQLGRIIPSLRVTWGIVIAILAAVLIHYYLFSTSSGFQLRAVGQNITAARFNGFAVKRYVLMSFVVSGAIAGLGGGVELMGTQFRLISGFAVGFGFDGVAIALIAQRNPLATLLVAYFFAVLRTGATSMQAGSGVPTSVINIIQALVIIFSMASFALVRLPQVRLFIQRLGAKKKEAQ